MLLPLHVLNIAPFLIRSMERILYQYMFLKNDCQGLPEVM
jgi:hypothetical protein